MLRRTVPALAMLTLAACAGAGPQGTSPKGPRATITRQEIEDAHVQDAYEAVRRLRPQMLVTHGPASLNSPGAGQPQVYVDGVPMGGLDALSSIRPEQVKEIRWISPADATTRYGTNHTGGVIEVITIH